MDCSLPGSSVHGIFQARVLEWGAIAFSHICAYVQAKIYTYTFKQYADSCVCKRLHSHTFTYMHTLCTHLHTCTHLCTLTHMHTCMHTYLHTHAHPPTHMHTHVHTHLHACTNICTHLHAHIHMLTHLHAHTTCRLLCVHTGTQFTHARTHTHMHTRTYAHSHTYIHAHTYAHSHICTHTCAQAWRHHLCSQLVQIHGPLPPFRLPPSPASHPTVLHTGNANTF